MIWRVSECDELSHEWVSRESKAFNHGGHAGARGKPKRFQPRGDTVEHGGNLNAFNHGGHGEHGGNLNAFNHGGHGEHWDHGVRVVFCYARVAEAQNFP